MKTLFIYFSYTGSGDLVAERLASKGAEVRKVQMKKALPRSFFFGILKGGFLALTKKKSALLDWNKNIEGYDHIIIGSPIWNARISSPINTVLSSLSLENKPLTFVFYAGSGTGQNAEMRVANEYPNAKALFLKEPKKYQEELDKLDPLL